jgi:uncharacterized protein YjbI with pentapeptide repeats
MTLPTDEPSRTSAGASDSTRGPFSPPPRYKAMQVLRQGDPVTPERFAAVLAQHAEFLANGGAGGGWMTLVTTANYEVGTVFGVYRGPKATAGAQAKLSHEVLDGLKLRGVDLSYADLCGVGAVGQDLSGANLAGCLAIDSDLTGARFVGANLAQADFSRAELRGCNFQDADLRGTDFENADLTDADFTAAQLAGARFPGAVLEGVRPNPLPASPLRGS